MSSPTSTARNAIDTVSAPAARVLLADAKDAVRDRISKRLLNAGYSVELAEDGDKAIASMDLDVSVAVLDLDLPVIDGPECLKLIRERFPNTEVIVITDRDDLEQVIEALKDGAYDYLTKPVHLDELAALVRRAAEKSRQSRKLEQAEAALAEAREKEIETAAIIQSRLLVGRPPEDIVGVDIATTMLASGGVDGDFCDFFKHGLHCFDVLIGDVMGKGLSAAVLSAAAKSQFLRVMSKLMSFSAICELPSPERIVTMLHSELVRRLIELESFLTMCYARFDVGKRRIEFVDCGHTKTIHYQHRERRCVTLSGENLPLGFAEQEVYSEQEVSFEPNDVFVFYSDGLIEMPNENEEAFGLDRLKDCIERNAQLGPEAISDRILARLKEFAKTDVWEDDVTCVVVKVRDLDADQLQTKKTIELRSDLKNLACARWFTRTVCLDATLDARSTYLMELAVSEALSNVMKYSYHGRTKETIQIKAGISPGKVSMSLVHWGDPFSPGEISPLSLDVSRERGYGLSIIKESVDELEYKALENGENVISIVKMRH